MITIKLPYKTTVENVEIIRELQASYSPMIRTSYNRSMEGWREKEIRNFLRNQFGQEDSWFLQSCVKEGITLAATDTAAKRKTRVFCGKKNFLLRVAGKISNACWKQLRIQPLPIIGEAIAGGNRKFEFDVISGNRVIFKMNKKNHLSLELPKLRKNMKSILEKLELAANSDILPITIKLTTEHICFTYDEIRLAAFISSQKTLNPIPGRCAGIDLNPNYIGIFIRNIGGELIDLSNLTQKSGQASSSAKSKYQENKLRHETVQLAERIAQKLIHYRVETLSLEDLKFRQEDKGLGRTFNRLTSNVWKRQLFVTQLVKRCQLAGIKVKLIHPAYTSFIGNIQHDLPDPISAAAEICRRGTSIQFYPELKIKENLANLWKEALGSEFLKSLNSWKELYAAVKNAKLKYRVPIDSSRFQKFISRRSRVEIQRFQFSA
jgi:IS605 OrfB family transposase